MPIVPDTKNWAVVLEHPCPECGFDARKISFGEIPSIIRKNVESWQRIIADHPALTVRPNDSTWSPLEYAAHVRDLYRIMIARLHLILVLDNPQFPGWHQDDTAIKHNYNGQQPSVISAELAVAGHVIAKVIEGLRPDELLRIGLRSDGNHFTVESLSLLAVHDPSHHIWDVTGSR